MSRWLKNRKDKQREGLAQRREELLRQGIVSFNGTPVVEEKVDSGGLPIKGKSPMQEWVDLARAVSFPVRPISRPMLLPSPREEYLEHQLRVANDKIDKLRQTIQSHKQPTTDPFQTRRMDRALEKIDYTEWVHEDEELLEEDYKGWPIPKPRVIF